MEKLESESENFLVWEDMIETLYETPLRNLRPREKLQHGGIRNLGDVELVQLILGSGCRQVPVETLARRCLDVLDREGLSCSFGQIKEIPGMGPAKAAQILASLELARRLFVPRGTRVNRPRDVYPFLVHYAHRPQEVFLVVSLNGAHELIAVHPITIGLLNRTLIHPREVFACALNDRAANIVLAHTHPSGNLEPSREDRDVTHRLANAGRLMGIEVLDHLIFSTQGFYSFREQGELSL